MLRATVALFAAHCPHCRSIDFRVVDPRNALERACHWLLQSYCCGLCGHHFFLFRWQDAVGGTA